MKAAVSKFADKLAPIDSLPPGNDDSTLKKDLHEENFQVYSNPLFEFDNIFNSSNVNPLFEEKDKDVEIKSFSFPTLTSPEESELILEEIEEKDSIPPGVNLNLPPTFEFSSSNPTSLTLTGEKDHSWKMSMFFSLVRFVWKMMKRNSIRKKIICLLATYLHKKPKPLSRPQAAQEEIKIEEDKVSSDVPINTIVMPIRITFDNPIDFNDNFSKPKDFKKDLTVTFDSTKSSIFPPPLLDSDSPFTAELSASITLNSLGNEDKVFKPGGEEEMDVVPRGGGRGVWESEESAYSELAGSRGVGERIKSARCGREDGRDYGRVRGVIERERGRVDGASDCAVTVAIAVHERWEDGERSGEHSTQHRGGAGGGLSSLTVGCGDETGTRGSTHCQYDSLGGDRSLDVWVSKALGTSPRTGGMLQKKVFMGQVNQRCTDISKITRKQSKTGKHGHEKRKSTREAKDSKPKPEKVKLQSKVVKKSKKVNSQSTSVNYGSTKVKSVISMPSLAHLAKESHVDVGKHTRMMDFALLTLTKQAQMSHHGLPAWQSV
ncbi:hypothetical protein Tco_1317007 [Tanacetum coccineum]